MIKLFTSANPRTSAHETPDDDLATHIEILTNHLFGAANDRGANLTPEEVPADVQACCLFDDVCHLRSWLGARRGNYRFALHALKWSLYDYHLRFHETHPNEFAFLNLVEAAAHIPDGETSFTKIDDISARKERESLPLSAWKRSPFGVPEWRNLKVRQR